LAKHPDVLGYTLEEAINVLNLHSLKWIIKESLGKTNNKEGITRIIKTKVEKKDIIELIISYF